MIKGMGFAHGFEIKRRSRPQPALQFTNVKQKFIEQFGVAKATSIGRNFRL